MTIITIYLIISLLFGYVIKNLSSTYFKLSLNSKILCIVYSPILIPYLIGLYSLKKYKFKKSIKNKSLLKANKYVRAYCSDTKNLWHKLKQFLELDFFFPTSTKTSQHVGTICYVFLMVSLTMDSTTGWKYNLINTYKNICLSLPWNYWANWVGQRFILSAKSTKLLDNDVCRTAGKKITEYYSYKVKFGKLKIYKTIYNNGSNLFLTSIKNAMSNEKEDISIKSELIYNQRIFNKKRAFEILHHFRFDYSLFDEMSFHNCSYWLRELNTLNKKTKLQIKKMKEILEYISTTDLSEESRNMLKNIFKIIDTNDVKTIREKINQFIGYEKNNICDYKLSKFSTYWKDLFGEWFY